MRPFRSTISIDEARRLLAESVRPIERIERVPIRLASGRVSAATVLAETHVPPFSRAAMDGYAVRAADVERASSDAPTTLAVVDRIFTGQVSRVAIRTGECAEIATGAPLPQGADAVVMVEHTQAAGAVGGGERVQILAPAGPGQHVGQRGADLSPGDTVVRHGDWLTPARVGALAAIGLTEVDVFAQPHVAMVSTGNEVIAPGEPLGPGQIHDVNRFTLAAVASQHGCVPVVQPPTADTLDDLRRAIDRAHDADVIVFSGGSSVGERDLLVDAIEGRGNLVFHGIAVKPGKPTAFAIVGGKPFFGMPGNPTSCLSNAYILLIPFLRATARLPIFAPHVVQAPLARRIVSTAGRHQFYTVQLRDGAAHPAFKGSGEITSLSRADGYIEIPSDRDSVDEGSIVEVVLF